MADIIMIGEGRHNEALTESVRRLNESGQWKKQRIVYVIPGGSTISARTYISHRGLIFPPNQAMVPLYVENAEVGAAYDEAIAMILANPTLRDWEYVLTIEADNIPPQDGVVKLVARMEQQPELACVGGLYWTKGPEGVPQIWGDPHDPVLNFRPQMPEPAKLVECCGTGMGFNLWRMSMFRELEAKKVPRPWFKTVADKTGMGTQDLYFWSLARKHGFRCAIDCSVLVGHLDVGTGIVW